MGTIRDEIERLDRYHHKILNYEYETVNLADVLSILSRRDPVGDKWELLAEGKIWEPREGASEIYPEALYLQTGSALAPLIRILMGTLRPDNHVAIYRKREEQDG